MKHLLTIAFSISILASYAQDFTVKYSNGLRVESADGSTKFKFGGRIQNHYAFGRQDPALSAAIGPFSQASEFRRSRFAASGTVYDNISFKAQYDFAGGEAGFKDVFINIGGVPVVENIRIGHFKEPFGLDQMNSSNDMTFIERATPYDMAPGRNNGIAVMNTALNKRLTYWVGSYMAVDGFGETNGDNRINHTGRITALPIWNMEGRPHYMHLGMAYSYRTTLGNIYQAKTYPEVHTAPTILETGIISDVEAIHMYGPEFAYVYGPLNIMSEISIAQLKRPEQGDASMYAFAVEASFFLTGESKVYGQDVGFFKRVKPTKNFGKDGWGGFELAARYGKTDWTNNSVNAGDLNTMTFGLNWYLNPQTRFSFNQVFTERPTIGDARYSNIEFQITF